MGQSKFNPTSQAKKRGELAPAPQEVLACPTLHGHNGTHVVLGWERPIQFLQLTLAEVKEFQAAMNLSVRTLEEHLEKFPGGQPLGPGSDQSKDAKPS